VPNAAVALKRAVGAAIVLERSEIERQDVTLQAELVPDVPPGTLFCVALPSLAEAAP
jgi:hypothetical protein